MDLEFNDNQSEINMREMEQELELDDDSVVAKAHKIHNKTVIIGMSDARTLELFKGRKGDSTVASGDASRRTGFEGSVGALTVNPNCPIRKKEEHTKRLVENAAMKGKLDNNKLHTQQLEDKIQAFAETSALIAALLQNTDDATPHAFQDTMKELVANFDKHSTSPIDAQAPAP